MRCSEGAWDIRSFVVTALCNQREAFASDLGDDQSHYLLFNINILTSLNSEKFSEDSYSQFYV